MRQTGILATAFCRMVKAGTEDVFAERTREREDELHTAKKGSKQTSTSDFPHSSDVLLLRK